MVTGLELIGALAAIGQLASQGVDFARRLRRFKRAMKNVREDITLLSDEVAIFSGNLCNFQRSVKRLVDLKCAVVHNKTSIRLVKKIQRSSQIKMAEISEILKRVKLLQRVRNPSKIATFTARLKWTIFDRPDVRELLMGIYSMNTSISVFCSVALLEQLAMEMQELRAANKQIHDDLKTQMKVFSNEVKLRIRQCEKAERDCEKLRNRITSGMSTEASAPDMVIKIAEVVKALAQDELKKTRHTYSEPTSSRASVTPSSPPAAAFSSNTMADQGSGERSENNEEVVEEQHEVMQENEEQHPLSDTLPMNPSNGAINQGGSISSTDSFRPHRARHSTSSTPPTRSSLPQEHPTSRSEEVFPNASSRRRPSSSVMWVIHDNGEFIAEEFRQPRSPPTAPDEVDEDSSDFPGP